MAGRLHGKIALISGGAGGCGLAAAELFAREGAAVGIVDLPHSQGEAVASRLRGEGFKAVFAAADVSNEVQVEQAVKAVSGDLGPVTVLFNHAGTIGRFLRPRSRNGTG